MFPKSKVDLSLRLENSTYKNRHSKHTEIKTDVCIVYMTLNFTQDYNISEKAIIDF